MNKTVDKYWMMYHRANKFDRRLCGLGLQYAVGKWIFYSYGKDSKLASGCGAEIIGTTVHHNAKFLILRNKFSHNNLQGSNETLIEVPYRHLNRIRLITEEEMYEWNIKDKALKKSDFDIWGIVPKKTVYDKQEKLNAKTDQQNNKVQERETEFR